MLTNSVIIILSGAGEKTILLQTIFKKVVQEFLRCWIFAEFSHEGEKQMKGNTFCAKRDASLN